MSEMTAWLTQCGIIAAVLAGAAWLWETGARWSGRSSRWAWLAALAGSVGLPFVLRLLPAPTWSEVVPPVGVVRIDALSVAAAAPAAAPMDFTRIGIALWVLLSALVLSYALVLLVRLARARRKWRSAEVDGARVLVSRNVGPAAVGVRRGVVVIPAWALQLDVELRRLMLLHEREHVRAGDPRLLLGALALVAVMPWNPLVWLQVVRLRNAIELDCDARVLRHGADPKRYGSLLLEIGRRRGGSSLVFATFAEPHMFLHERIRRIARWPSQRRPLRAAALSVIALALFSTSLLARVRVESMPAATPSEFGVFGTVVDVAERLIENAMPVDTPPPIPAMRPDPRATPYTQAPVLQNTDVIMQLMTANYPAALRDAGIGGTAAVWVLVDEKGDVRFTQLSKPTGYPALDEAALRVSKAMLFAPALNGQRATPAWIEVPIAFGKLAHSVSVNAQPTVAPAAASSLSDGPQFTPMTVRPELKNMQDVQRALVESYPPLLRDAGIGGTALVWFFIDDTGRVVKTQTSKSTGYPALDEAALRVAGMMQFSPARNRDQNVNVWVEIPILFAAKKPDGSSTSREELAVIQARQREAARRADGVNVAIPLETIEVSGVRAERSADGVRIMQLPPPPREPVGDITERPTFTPMTVRPELQNQADVARALVRNYPPLLRDAGIGGTTVVWFFINDEGQVQKTQLSKSSGYPALDEAAMRVAETMQFSPARNRDKIVQVWVEIPILFAAK